MLLLIGDKGPELIVLPCLDSCVQIGDQSARSEKFTPVSCKVQGSRAPDMLENSLEYFSRFCDKYVFRNNYGII